MCHLHNRSNVPKCYPFFTCEIQIQNIRPYYSSLNSLNFVVQENRASRLHVTRVRGPPPNCANNLTNPPRSNTSQPASQFPEPPPSQSPHHPLTTSRVYTIAMYVYESSPRRSPRRVPRTEGNVLKQKTGSPIRKGKVTQGG